MEDDRLTRHWLVRELVLLGWQVEAASTRDEAIALTSARVFDALVADFRLPDGDGVDLIQELKNLHK